jgi:Muramidase (flagellum-specific)
MELNAPPLRVQAPGEVSAPGTATQAAAPVAARSGDSPPHVEAFVQKLLPHARAASASSGIPASFMMGQAALETGWGRSEIRGADGQNSHNLFGIKAGGSWKGRTVDIVTTEYVNGKPQKQVDTFRAYDSYADAFRDYANLLRGNARYQNAIAQGQDAAGFAQGLAAGGLRHRSRLRPEADGRDPDGRNDLTQEKHRPTDSPIKRIYIPSLITLATR